MVHGDHKGLVLPPRVAPIQMVIVPITMKKNLELVTEKSRELFKILKDWGFRVELDDRDNYKPGKKYNYWELKGVPIRIELGGRDIEKNGITIARRDKLDEDKQFLSNEGLEKSLRDILDNIHNNLYQKAKTIVDQRRVKALTLEEFDKKLNGNAVLVPFCEVTDCENNIKEHTEKTTTVSESDIKFELTGKAKSLCIPFDQPELPLGTKCFFCKQPAKSWTYFGRSY